MVCRKTPVYRAIPSDWMMLPIPLPPGEVQSLRAAPLGEGHLGLQICGAGIFWEATPVLRVKEKKPPPTLEEFHLFWMFLHFSFVFSSCWRQDPYSWDTIVSCGPAGAVARERSVLLLVTWKWYSKVWGLIIVLCRVSCYAILNIQCWSSKWSRPLSDFLAWVITKHHREQSALYSDLVWPTILTLQCLPHNHNILFAF